MTVSSHSEDIYRLAEKLNTQERKIIDFSTSVNPLGVSKKIKAEIRRHLKYLHNYPDATAKRLKRHLAQYHGIDAELIICGNGSTELIYLITRALKPQKVLIPVPTFPEYERAVSVSQTVEHKTEMKYLLLKEENGFEIRPDEFIAAMMELGQGSSAIAFLCNPNDPTGRLLKKKDVLRIIEASRDLKCYLVVDEAFIDFCPEDTVINEVQNCPYLIVLRSMTKFYALSGLRIGYGVFPKGLIETLNGYKEPWTLNSLAQRAAVVAIKDKVYRKETFRLMSEEKRFLEKSFKGLEIEFFPSDANFYLLKMHNAREIYEKLKRKYILLKDCSNFKGLDGKYLRVAIKSHRENSILIKELKNIFGSSPTMCYNRSS